MYNLLDGLVEIVGEIVSELAELIVLMIGKVLAPYADREEQRAWGWLVLLAPLAIIGVLKFLSSQ